jgi:hypothetical protein
MSALLCGIDQIYKVALPLYKAQVMPNAVMQDNTLE